MRVKISISAADIEHGVRKDRRGSPIARAVQRALPGYTVSVLGDCLFIERDSDRTEQVVYLPRMLRLFVYAFDAGEPVVPLSCTIEVA